VGVPTIVTFTRLPVEPVGVVVSLIEVALAVVLVMTRRQRRARRQDPADDPAAALDGDPASARA
jgi:hypothetical protein